MKFMVSERLNKLPPYLFAEIDRVKNELRAQGKELIDLGVGDPDQPTPPHIIEALAEAARDPFTHTYALGSGMEELREAIASWYIRRFGVKLDPDTEVLPLLGSKEGIAHIPLAFVNPGDIVLVPDPGYPVYASGTIFAGGTPVTMGLLEENGFLADLNAIEGETAARARLMFLNYPNNPTAAVCDLEYFESAAAFARKNEIILCHDAAYTELAFDGYNPPSFLQAAGAKEVGIEFHSLSKTYNMTGWRAGFAVGNADIIRGLNTVKSNIDSGIFRAVQMAAVAALNGPQDFRLELLDMYRRRRDLLVEGLNSLGWKVNKPRATFYVWCPVPEGYDSSSFTTLLLEEAGIVTTPGVGLGSCGEGYVRMTLTRPEDELSQAVERLGKLEVFRS
ncbi:MAG: pyridoxal phosphate-dependent aminotransferase [Candidatus Auribacterota bacterium]|nr:pyridoxal phosphate-dependent aminotransferase [Candidatus Auribacterota bacterium]